MVRKRHRDMILSIALVFSLLVTRVRTKALITQSRRDRTQYNSGPSFQRSQALSQTLAELQEIFDENFARATQQRQQLQLQQNVQRESDEVNAEQERRRVESEVPLPGSSMNNAKANTASNSATVLGQSSLDYEITPLQKVDEDLQSDSPDVSMAEKRISHGSSQAALPKNHRRMKTNSQQGAAVPQGQASGEHSVQPSHQLRHNRHHAANRLSQHAVQNDASGAAELFGPSVSGSDSVVGVSTSNNWKQSTWTLDARASVSQPRQGSADLDPNSESIPYSSSHGTRYHQGASSASSPSLSSSTRSSARGRPLQFRLSPEEVFGMATRTQETECPRQAGRHYMACPTAHRRGYTVCIADRDLCDGIAHCPGQEDEDPTSCLFYTTFHRYFKMVMDSLTELTDVVAYKHSEL